MTVRKGNVGAAGATGGGPGGGGGGGSSSTIVANVYTDDHDLELADAGTVVEVDKATAVAVTILENADVAFPVDTVLEVCQAGAGPVTVLADGAVVLEGGPTVTTAPFQSLFLRQRAIDEWVVTASLTLGEIGYAELVAPYAQTGAGDSLVPGMSITVAAPGGRPIMVSASGELQHSASGSSAAMTIEEDGTQILEIGFVAAANGQIVPVQRSVRRTPPAGLHTYRVRLFSTVTGNATLVADDVNPAWLNAIQV